MRHAYVQVGSKINADSIVCIVEAMKLFNEIEAEVDGEIVEILVKDGQLVEYGQPLFLVKGNLRETKEERGITNEKSINCQSWRNCCSYYSCM